MGKISDRKQAGATCPKCNHPNYEYLGRANAEISEYWERNGKHEFKCTKCGNIWQYGKGESKYTKYA